jgi:predicted transcriptional regulator of viral defense system
MRSEEFIKMINAAGSGVFSIDDAAFIIGKPKSYVSLFLSKNRHIGRIERGKYYIKGSNIYQIASNILFPSYVSLESAFRYYNLITQMPIEVQIISTVQHKNISVEGYRIKVVTFPKDRAFGYSNKEGVFVADVEKAIIDAVYLRRDEQYINEAFENALNEQILDINKLKQYANQMRSKVLLKRILHLINANEARL